MQRETVARPLGVTPCKLDLKSRRKLLHQRHAEQPLHFLIRAHNCIYRYPAAEGTALRCSSQCLQASEEKIAITGDGCAAQKPAMRSVGEPFPSCCMLIAHGTIAHGSMSG